MKKLWVLPLLVLTNVCVADNGSQCVKEIMELRTIIREQSASLSFEEISQIKTSMKAAYEMGEEGSEAECMKSIEPFKKQFSFKEVHSS